MGAFKSRYYIYMEIEKSKDFIFYFKGTANFLQMVP